MARVILEFEKPIDELEQKIEALRNSLDRLFTNTNSFEKTDVRGEK